MSGVRIEGHVPAPRAVRGALDRAAREAVRDAGRAALPVVKDAAPGGLGSAMELRVRETQHGHAAVIGPARRKRYRSGTATGAQVTRWVTHGTGIYRKGGGPKRPITGRRGVFGTMTLPGGTKVRSVKGQRPNPFVARASDRADAAARRAARAGASRAADEIGRL